MRIAKPIGHKKFQYLTTQPKANVLNPIKIALWEGKYFRKLLFRPITINNRDEGSALREKLSNNWRCLNESVEVEKFLNYV
uniref:Transposase n=1 Tax=Heterorhabditis bacteriophora TaxID=37862 RepID=A0A1I7XDW9_HETBA